MLVVFGECVFLGWMLCLFECYFGFEFELIFIDVNFDLIIEGIDFVV